MARVSSYAKVLVALSLLCGAWGYEFDMLFQTKCVMENVVERSEVTGTFWAFNKHEPGTPMPVDFKVRGTIMRLPSVLSSRPVDAHHLCTHPCHRSTALPISWCTR